MIKLITHNDLDGVGCYVVAKYFLDAEIDVSYCDYKNVNEIVLNVIKNHEQYDEILITDISVNEEVAEKLNNLKGKVKLLDHHPTALFLNKYTWAKVEIECDKGKTCGTQMLFDDLKSVSNDYIKCIPKLFVELVRRYDTWEWKDKYNDEKPRKLNDLMYIVGKEYFIEDMLLKINTGVDIFDKFSLKLLELRQKEVDRYIEKKDDNLIIKDILGYNVGIVFADNFISELGDKLSELHPELDFIAMINQETISYRTTKDNINLSEIAKHFGGGGHPKASGSQMDERCVYDFIEDIFKYKIKS